MQDVSDDDLEEGTERERLMDQLRALGEMAGMVAKVGLVRSTRLAKPFIRGYAGCPEESKDDDSPDDTGELPGFDLTPMERALLATAGEKLAFETIELATRAYPPTQGIEPYRAVKGEDGCYPAPHLAHVLSLGRAVRDLFDDQPRPDREPFAPPDGAELQVRQPVLLTALNGDEYGYLTGPIEPRTIRRIALNERDRMLNENGDN